MPVISVSYDLAASIFIAMKTSNFVFFTLKMEAAKSSETLSYHNTWHRNTEDPDMNLFKI